MRYWMPVDVECGRALYLVCDYGLYGSDVASLSGYCVEVEGLAH